MSKVDGTFKTCKEIHFTSGRPWRDAQLEGCCDRSQAMGLEEPPWPWRKTLCCNIFKVLATRLWILACFSSSCHASIWPARLSIFTVLAEIQKSHVPSWIWVSKAQGLRGTGRIWVALEENFWLLTLEKGPKCVGHCPLSLRPCSCLYVALLCISALTLVHRTPRLSSAHGLWVGLSMVAWPRPCV